MSLLYSNLSFLSDWERHLANAAPGLYSPLRPAHLLYPVKIRVRKGEDHLCIAAWPGITGNSHAKLLAKLLLAQIQPYARSGGFLFLCLFFPPIPSNISG